MSPYDQLEDESYAVFDLLKTHLQQRHDQCYLLIAFENSVTFIQMRTNILHEVNIETSQSPKIPLSSQASST